MTDTTTTPPAGPTVDRSDDGERPPTASPSRTWTAPRPNATGGTRITVKRVCNGCGKELGDATDEELYAAVAGDPLPDVREECPTCPSDAVTAFNAAHPVGTVVRYWTGAREGDGKLGYLWHHATFMASGRPVAWIRERATDENVGAVSLSHVVALTPEEVAELPTPDPLAPVEVEVTMTVSWRAIVDVSKPEWSWLEREPRSAWERLIQEDMEQEPTAYESFCAAADGPYSGPDYSVEVWA